MTHKYLEKIQRINLVRELNKKQKIVDSLFESEGLTDQVLTLQLEINKTRNKENIPDDSEKIYKNFVQ